MILIFYQIEQKNHQNNTAVSTVIRMRNVLFFNSIILIHVRLIIHLYAPSENIRKLLVFRSLKEELKRNIVLDWANHSKFRDTDTNHTINEEIAKF